MEFILHILAGATVGLAVGLTGIGGGSLMTPILLMFGYPAHIAIGTDLLYAGITKSAGVNAHRKQGTIRWRIVLAMAAGSLPAAIIAAILLGQYFDNSHDYKSLLTTSLGIMLTLTGIVILLKNKLQAQAGKVHSKVLAAIQGHRYLWTFIMGLALGALVTLSSVGAGAIGTALLLLLYPRLPSIQVIGTDIAHAVPLTLVAGFSHLLLGNVDFSLLLALLIGSLPAIQIGTRLATRIPDGVLQPALAIILLGIGIKYIVW